MHRVKMRGAGCHGVNGRGQLSYNEPTQTPCSQNARPDQGEPQFFHAFFLLSNSSHADLTAGLLRV